MKNLLNIISISIVLLTCSSNKNSYIGQFIDTAEKNESKSVSSEIIAHKNIWKDTTPYDLEISISKTEELYSLDIMIEPDSGSYILSHHSSGDFVGKFKLILIENKYLSLKGDLAETPSSVYQYEPWSREEHLTITSRTIVSHNFSSITKDNFELNGQVEFTIEPKCTYEVNKFKIKHINGKFSIELL